MIRRAALSALAAVLVALVVPASASAAEECDLEPRSLCFGLESLEAALSTTQAGDHPDLTFTFEAKQDPESETNPFGLHDGFATTRNVRFELPPGLIGEPNVLGVPQQCTVQELVTFSTGGGCPNGSQVGVTSIFAYDLNIAPTEPVYMMAPPGGDVVARLGFIAGIFPTFVDAKVRSESDYGLTLEIVNASPEARLIRAETTTWGVPAHPSHNTERCTPEEAFPGGCVVSPSRPPGSRPLPFLTNPTSCGVPLEMRVSLSSWAEPQRFDTRSASFPQISGCNKLPFGPGLVIEPTNQRASAPTGLDVTARLPASDGVDVLEPSQTRDIRVTLPQGVVINPGSADGLDVCSAEQVKFGTREAAQCPDAAKLAEFEAEIPALPRRLKGAIYLREPQPGNLFRAWAVADDQGAHVKLPAQLNVDKQSGQIESVLLDIPQVPTREVKLVFKSGFRAPLANPPACGDYVSDYEFTPWSGGAPVSAKAPMSITEGCGLGGFSPRLDAGTTNPAAGRHSPFLFTLYREDGEQNPAALDVALPPGLTASFAGIPRCAGVEADTGACPAASRIGKVIAAVGYGAAPLWVPQPAKDPTAVYLAGPYKGAPLSVIAVVPAQAGPFDLGDEVVRSALYVDPVTGQGTVRSDPLPQINEGIPIRYRTIQVQVDRPDFTLNPTSCALKHFEATVTSIQGAQARPTAPFQATNCAKLPFKPKLSFQLRGGTHRGAHPSLRVVLKGRPGDANIAALSAALPRSEFLDQAHIKTVCTRVQFAAQSCPAGSVYGHATAKTPLFDETLSGPVYLRSSSNPLPDVVIALKGPAGLPIEVNVSNRVDSVNGGIRTSAGFVPDAPVSSFVLTMQGGKKGLLVNSTNLCEGTHRATVKLKAHNGKKLTLQPEMQARCGGKGSGKRKR